MMLRKLILIATLLALPCISYGGSFDDELSRCNEMYRQREQQRAYEHDQWIHQRNQKRDEEARQAREREAENQRFYEQQRRNRESNYNSSRAIWGY